MAGGDKKKNDWGQLRQNIIISKKEESFTVKLFFFQSK